MAAPNHPAQTQSEDGRRVESSYVSPPPQDEPNEWEQPARQSAWAARHFGAIQLAALGLTLLGMVLTLIAAIRAANPTPQIVVTFAGVGLLMFTVLRPPEVSG